MSREEVLVHVLNICIVIRSPYLAGVSEYKIDGGRQITGDSLPPNTGLIRLSPVGPGIKITGFYFSDVADFIHLGHQPRPVCDILPQPEAIKLIFIGLP